LRWSQEHPEEAGLMPTCAIVRDHRQAQEK